MTRSPWVRDVGAVEGLIAVAGVVAGTSLYGAVAGPLLLPLSLFGALVSLVALAIASRLRLLAGEWIALSLALLVVFGGVAAGPVPSPGAYATFFRGLIDGWAELLTTVPPAELTGTLRVMPYALAWLGTTVGLALHRLRPVPTLPMFGPMAAFALGLLFSLDQRAVALTQGALLAGLALAVGLFMQRRRGEISDHTLGHTTAGRKRARLAGVVGILVLISVVSPVVAESIPGLDGRDRFDLRDRLDPPWDPLDEPSPLAQMKANYQQAVRDDIVFVAETESGVAVPQRWALATLAAYDGRVWTVGDSTIQGEAPFVPIDGPTPAAPTPPNSNASSLRPNTIAVDVTLKQVRSPWLPVPGGAQAIELAATGDKPNEVRFNRFTGTAAVPSYASVGDGELVYRVVATPWPLQTLDDLMASTVVAADPDALPPGSQQMVDRAADLLEGAEAGWPQVVALQARLRGDGFYTADDAAVPGHSWSRLSAFVDGELLAGNEEQYASLAGIVGRHAGLATRVVVGFDASRQPDRSSELVVTRADASAWIEVRTEEYGWVPVDVTPDRDKEPTFEEEGFQEQAIATPNPPPPPPPPPKIDAEQAPEEEEEENPRDDEEMIEARVPPMLIAAAGAATFPFAFALAWCAAIGGAKVWRRRRRRNRKVPSARVSGAWCEAVDRLGVVGYGHLVGASQGDAPRGVVGQATAVQAIAPGLNDLTPLAKLVDEAAFSADGASEHGANEAWEHCGRVVASLRSSVPIRTRIAGFVNPKPLLRKDPSS